MFPEATVFPSTSQVIVGVGLPVAEQYNVVSSFSRTVWLSGTSTKLGGTANAKIVGEKNHDDVNQGWQIMYLTLNPRDDCRTRWSGT